MSEDDERIKQSAEAFARANRKRIAKEFTDPKEYASEQHPVSIFMAGSPGAGKTEFSRALLELELEDGSKRKMIRMDADELRTRLPGYTGANSYLFQGAVSILIEKIHDLALENKQSFILDSTLSNPGKAIQNIDRSLHRNRSVFVMYVYQRPEVAWKFTQSRELVDGRNIQKETFIREYCAARETVKEVLAKFDGLVTVVLIKKNFEDHSVETIQLIANTTQIDASIGHAYTKEDLEQLL